jgi:hypothetical protein
MTGSIEIADVNTTAPEIAAADQKLVPIAPLV